MHTHRQETNRIGQQKLAELRDQLRFAATEAERRTLATQIVFWRRQPSGHR